MGAPFPARDHCLAPALAFGAVGRVPLLLPVGGVVGIRGVFSVMIGGIGTCAAGVQLMSLVY
ncbi:hypothetical protein CFP66_19790 [Pseudonocardia sp. MH-G8]|nr:hypothetical protein CFP66_19790 [Pseudonocardia sp. MH-G8]